MFKAYKTVALVILAAFVLVLGASDPADAKKKKKKIPKKPSYVGSVKCNGSCHDPYYQALLYSPHGKTFELLQAGVRPEAK